MDNDLSRFITLIKQHNKNTVLNPMPAEQLNALRMKKYRDEDNNETVELPESLKALLAYDRDLISPYNTRIFENLQFFIDGNTIKSDTYDELAYWHNNLDMMGLEAEELMPIWNNPPLMPALIPINHPGDQAIMIYVTERDQEGEYPITRMERNEVWLAESSLIEYLSDIFEITDRVDIDQQFASKLEKYTQRDSHKLELEDFHQQIYKRFEEFDD